MNLGAYRPLGRSGLIVSPLALGTMTFGTGRWGSDHAGSQAIFDAYVEAGGNFVDTADVYAGGGCEEMLGRFIAERGLRNRIVVATKAGFPLETGHPHAGGNGAKHVHAAVDSSLRRLAIDHVDLFWLHVWDQVTPVEEALNTLANLVRVGKIRYFGLSNVPAWYVARMATLAQAHGTPGPIALQFQYSLIERDVEHEHLPAARELGMAMVPWSPLGGGFLTGKYTRESTAGADATSPEASSTVTGGGVAAGDGRLSGSNPFGDTKFTERNWRILDVVREVAADLGTTPARLALAWLTARRGVASVLIGASRPEQIAENIAALSVAPTPAQLDRLDAVTAPEPYMFGLFTPPLRRMVFGGQDVAGTRDG